MCGIAGIVRFDGTVVDRESLQRMSSLIAHRGPDDEGIWTDGQVGLAHRRLSIIDLGGSRQPMMSHDDTEILLFNGEILNFRELRGAIDYPYRTAGDTEVILAAHSAYGDDAPTLLQGQFAYALYDTRSRSLLLARDRMGILPLFWYQDSTRLLFASEITALIAGLDTTPSIDQEALAEYLAGRSVPAPGTLLAGVRKLPPGHILRVDADGSVRQSEYWSPAQLPAIEGLTPERAVDELDERLTNAVRRSLVADVPVGAYLSGGVDSSLVVAKVVQQAGHEGVHTFCAEFGDPRFDESSYAQTVSTALRTTHHNVPVRPDDFMDLWQWLSVHRGAPLSEPADIAVFRLAESARNHVKVVLSGEGSDELFGGYPKYRYARLTSLAGIVPAGLRRPALSVVERALPPRARRLGVALRALAEPTLDERIRGWFAPFTSRERQQMLGFTQRPVSGHGAIHPLRQMLLADLRSWLPDNLLERGDRMTMAASIELRPPFLDQEVVDFALSLPPDLLVRNGVGKWVVKQVARRHVPPQIVDRPKVGFRVPLDTWFRNGLRDFAWDKISAPSSITRTHLDQRVVRELFRSHDRGRHDESIRIWTLASLEVWYAGLLDPSPLASPSFARD